MERKGKCYLFLYFLDSHSTCGFRSIHLLHVHSIHKEVNDDDCDDYSVGGSSVHYKCCFYGILFCFMGVGCIVFICFVLFFFL